MTLAKLLIITIIKNINISAIIPNIEKTSINPGNFYIND